MFITLPVFMIVYRVVTILRPLKATNLFNIWNFTSIPMTEVFAGNWVFIFFLLIVIPVQILSMKIPQWLAKTRSRNTKAISNSGGKQFKKTMLIQYVFMAVMCVVVAMSATGVGVYWFFNSIFGVIQSYVVHKIILSSRRKNSTLESKLSKLGIE
jgi:YidC/Oxa1 family membrane protein insertase